LNSLTHGEHPGTMTAAEESTSFPGSAVRCTSAASASPTNGTWAGCTTSSSTRTRIRSTAAGITPRHLLRALHAQRENFSAALLPR
jgi:hypothetical protein